MDLDSLEDPNNYNCCKSSQINVISSTSGTEVTKLNESTSTKEQKQNKTEKFKIIEISKLQVPVKPIIASTSVINPPKINEKNINSHYTSSSLDNSSSTSGIEVRKLIESTSIKKQEQNKTEKFKILEISKQWVPVKPIIATTSVINSSKINKKNIDPHYTSSSLDNSSSTSGIEVTKLIESTSTKEQNKTEKFKILEISKQVPVKPIIATTSVINSSKINKKNIDPHYTSSSLDNSSSTSGIEVTKLIESTSTKEQNKTEKFKILEISKQVPVKPIIATTSVINSSKINKKNIDVTKLNEFTITKVKDPNKIENIKNVDSKNVEISITRGVPLTKMIATTLLINAPKKNENHIDPLNSHSDLSTLLNKNNSALGIEVTKLNESTSTKVQEQNKNVNFRTVDNNDVKTSNQQVPLKKMIATKFVLNTPKKNENNIYLRPNNFSLNLEKIAVPKAVLSNIKFIPPTLSNQIKKPPTIALMPTTTLINPKTTIITRLQPKSYPGKITNNKCVPTLKPGFKIISTNDPKSKMFLIPKGVNYIFQTINKEEVKNQSLPSFNSASTLSEPLNSIIPVSVAEKFNTIEKPKIQNKNSKFVVSCKEFQNQRFKILLDKKIKINEKNVKRYYESSTHFELLFPRSSKKFVRYLKRRHTDIPNPKVIKNADSSKSNHVQQVREQSFITSSLNEIKNTINFVGTSGKKKCIPHTITSKDVIDNHTNVVIENNKTKLNSNVKNELLPPPPGFIPLSSRPESSILKTYGQPLTVPKYGNFSNKNLSTVRLVPYNSTNQPHTKLDCKQYFIKIVKNNGSTSKSTIATVSSDKMMKVIPTKVYSPKNPKINIAPKGSQNKIPLSKPTTLQLLFPKEMKKEKPNPAYCIKRPYRCRYEFCQLIIDESKLIDNMYCSLECKKFDTKLQIANKSSCDIEQAREETPINKPVIDRKMLLAKLKSRINKRKQSLPSFQKQYEAAQQVDLVNVVNPDNETCKMPPPIPITVKHTFQKSRNRRKLSKANEPTIIVENGKIENENISSYLEHTDYIPAPKKLFDNPFPNDCNPFKVGQRLEGIDPEHEALFCVMTVVEVVGYRIKLHFDGYQDIYDFWVNANCPDLFYPRWCEQNSRTLQPPKNYKLPFNWTDYFRMPGVVPAPKWNFPIAIYMVNRTTDHSFCIGAKLEALDKLTRTLPKQLICVATVADILGNRIRIHFDGWTDDFDYWTDITSTNIHPIGWCDKNGRTLCPPSGYDNCRGKKPFSWTKYLQETNSEPVPEDAFIRRPLREFTNSMAIEVVDIANPSLVRIAKVVDVKGDELKILYDGFDPIYAYWIEDDSPNIHPLGWCLKTNHPIELFKVNAILWSCRVPGCNGKGNTKSSKNTHVFAKECPYEFESWKSSISGMLNIPDRVKPEDIPLSVENFSSSVSIVPREAKKKQKLKLNKIKSYNSNKPKRRKRINNKLKNKFKKKIPNGRSKTVYTRAVEAMNELENIKGVNDYTCYGYGSFKPPRLNVWTRHNVLQGIPIFSTTDARKWPIKEVADFVEKIVSNNYTDNNHSERIKISKSFINQDIDGEVFLMLTQKDLTDTLNIPLGPALKLNNAIVVLRQRATAFDIANGLL
ncbi:unnamed protein product [Macrosiphum euphorbiae]|uniref:SAM domain-containing protein n=1 Tax=Macrosiphum euphorbiae TaxID=13131 RepID=A0AAV0WUK4_9HEMI|nr:unnamed protein product [Macrosiphum euphorbiae]